MNRLSSLSLLALLYLSVVLFPGRYAPFGGPFEETWVYEINRLTAEFAWCGSAFSYGPLGFLLYPRDIGFNLLAAVGFYVLVHLLFLGLISYHAVRASSQLSVLFLAFGYSLAAALGLQGLGYEYHLMIVYGLLLAIRPEGEWAPFATAFSSGILAGILLFLKFNLGFCAFVMLMVRCLTDQMSASVPESWPQGAALKSLFAAVFPKTPSPRQAYGFVLGAAAGYFISVIVIASAYLPQVPDFFNWLRFSLDIALQYSVALSLSGPQALTYFALVGIAVYVMTSIWFVRWNPPAIVALCPFAVLIACAFKGGFVRQGGQEAMFFPTLIAVLSTVPLLSRSAWLPWAGGLSLLTMLALSIPAATYHRDLSRWKYQDVLALLTGQRGWEQVRALLHLTDLRRDMALQSAANLQTMRLPAPWPTHLRGRVVNAIPFGHVLCAANRLDCPPPPLLQLYTGGSSAIDQWNAGYYEGQTAPDYLIVQFADIDGRHPLWGVPATWRAIMRRYRPMDSPPGTGLLILGKRLTAASIPRATFLGRTTIRLNQWQEVPESNQLLFAGLDLRLSMWGHLRKLLFRIPKVTIDVQTASGIMRTYRMIPGSAANGLIMNYLPIDITTLKLLFRGHLSRMDRTVRYRVSGFGAAYYEPRVELIWLELPRPRPLFSGTQDHKRSIDAPSDNSPAGHYDARLVGFRSVD